MEEEKIEIKTALGARQQARVPWGRNSQIEERSFKSGFRTYQQPTAVARMAEGKVLCQGLVLCGQI